MGTIMCLSDLLAQSQCTVVGWASQNGGVTGGGSANATVVSNYTDLRTAITSSTVKVVHISGTITLPAAGRIAIQDQSGKTIYGLPGSKLVSGDRTKDGSGIFNVKRCSNIIFKNITFEGPAAYDADGWDNMVIDASTNIWVDHCEFQDGMDGNLDIKNASDFISVTWCKFIYNKAPIPDGPGGSDDHRFSNLFGSSDGATGDRGKLRITMQNCWWAQGCKARMPRVRFGKVHIVNNLFNSSVAAQCVMAGFEADLLVESNVFENVGKPIDKMDNKFTAITVRDNIFTNTTADTTGSGTAFTPPYALTITQKANVKSEVMAGAGATLTSADCSSARAAVGADQNQLLNQQLTSVFPNPAKGKAIISVTLGTNEMAVIRVYDALGRLVDNVRNITSVTGGTQQVPFNLNNKKPGVYHVVVTGNKGLKATYKLLVQ
jgi:pectate lyase